MLNGYTFLVQGAILEGASHDLPEPYASQLKAQAMTLYHLSAKDEDERRRRGEKPDHRHLTYL